MPPFMEKIMKGKWHKENEWLIFTPVDKSPELRFNWSNEFRAGQYENGPVYSISEEEYIGLIGNLDFAKDHVINGEIFPDEKTWA